MTTENSVAMDPEALVERLFLATLGALELFGVYLGVRLGLYGALGAHESLSVEGLAVAAGIHPRYAREWLEQQAVAGLVDVVDVAGGDGSDRQFSLPAQHLEVLAEPENLAHVAPFALMIAGIGQALPDVVEAYRTGGGVPWTRYGDDGRDGQAAINRPAYHHEMGGWISSMPDVRDRLNSSFARVADVGCGVGWSTIALARAFPSAHVDGFDLDPESIAVAAAHAADAGVADRVRFRIADASVAGSDLYELVCIFEALHDMSQPVSALEAARGMLTPGGAVLVVDERVADEFSAPGDEVERMMYGWSITLCLPASMADQPSAATGTVMRADVLRGYAADAGFSSVDVLDVPNDFFRFYRLGV